AADPGRDRREIGRAVGDRIGGERAEADVIAADRHHHQIDRPLTQLRRAPHLVDPRPADRGVAQRELPPRGGPRLRACGRAAPAEQIAQLIELRANLRSALLAEALASVHLAEYALRDLGARTGKAREGDRAMAILERELDADPERIAVLRAVAIAA